MAYSLTSRTSPLTRARTWLLLHCEDGIVDVMDWRKFTPGPLVALQRFLAESSDFEIDRDREKFILTYAPAGFLKCVRP